MSEKNKKDEIKSKEEECGCYANSRTEESCPPIRNVTHPLRYYEFTQDEMKALEDCDKESFYQRCLPFSTLFATATYAAIKYGHLNRNPHFGAVPKVFIAAFMGYFCGRISYLKNYEEKLRDLPANSYLGNVIRKYHSQNNKPSNPNKLR